MSDFAVCDVLGGCFSLGLMSGEAKAPENIVLVGFMGSGKSTVGKELHHRLGYPWVDMDGEIEARAGKSIAEIFAEKGESIFRERETELLREMAADYGVHRIISTGGGVVTKPENRELLRKLGFVVWLDAPCSVVLERTSRNKDRPLLHTDDPAGRIKILMNERRPWYGEVSHIKIDTSDLDSKELATGILESARYFFAHRA